MIRRNVFAIFAVVICLIVAFTTTKPSISFAEESYQSKSYCLMDAYSGTVICSGNDTERLPIASMCKIMTLILCFEEIDNGNLSLDDTICISETASGMGGSQIFLETNGVYAVKDLIKGIIIASANDACVAMAEKICGSEDLFVKKMNEKAKSLGMDNTNFVNATGLPQEGQYSCAVDCAKMFRELAKHKGYFEFSKIWMDKIQHPKGRFTEISNTNKLIRFYQGCDGGKTGFTSQAGHCLTATAEKNGLRLIAVVISAPDSKVRFKEVSSLFNYGFANYSLKNIVSADKELDFTAEIKGGKESEIKLIPEENFSFLCKKDEKLAFEVTFSPIDSLKAPICKGDLVGYLSIYKDGIEIESVKVLSMSDVMEKSFIDHLKDVASKWKLSA